MELLSWFSVVVMLALLGLYIYWSAREEQAQPAWVRNSFYGGLAFFAIVFVLFTWHTLSVIPVQTNAQALTAEVVAGKHAWHKYVCIDCHTLLGNGAYYAPDLTKTWDRFSDRAGGNEQAAQTALAAFLQNPPQATPERRGMTQMNVSAEEARQLAAFFQWVSRIDTNGWPPPPLRAIAQAAAQPPREVPPDAEQGQKLFSELGCVACHSVGQGRVVGPDLIDVAAKYDRATIVRWIADPHGLYHEKGREPLNPGYPEMPNLGIKPADAEAIAAYLVRAGGKE